MDYSRITFVHGGYIESCFTSELTTVGFRLYTCPVREELPRADFVLWTRKFCLRLILYYRGACIFPLCGTAVIVSISNAINMYVSLFSLAGAHRP